MNDEIKRTLRAEADITLATAGTVIDRVLDHLAQHEFAVSRRDGGGVVGFMAGEVRIVVRPDGLVMQAEAEHDAGLAYMKSVMASNILELSGEARPQIVWTGDGADATAFPNFREMTVTQVRDVSPHMRRVTLAGRDLDSFATRGLHIKLFVPPEGLSKPEWPVPGKDGLPLWPAEDKRPKVRTYTIRSIDPAAGIMEVDFVLHGGHGDDHSVGSRWARQAVPGAVVGIRGPLGRPVPAAEWYLLVGDETAIPAIARHLEALPPTARGVAIIEIADDGERQEIDNRSGIELRWLCRNGSAPGTTTLLSDAVRALQMPPPGTAIHAFAGVEAEAFKAIRNYWREELKLDKKDVVVSTYWRRGVAEGD